MKKRMKKVATLCLAGVTAMSTVGVTVWKPAEREEDPCMSVIRHRTMAIS